jgi:tetrapyrrole methylase family protein/MazG family protein
MPEIQLKKNPIAEQIAKDFERLIDVMYTLRSEGGCPWDRVQTLKDLKQYLLEETYELLEALDLEDLKLLHEELGDLLFQIVFLSQVLQEQNKLNLQQVIERLLQKMIGRHPHVFGDVSAGTPEEALANWEAVKKKQTLEESGRKRFLLEGVPLHLPALLQAHLISSKVARVGFDWPNESDVWKKLEEEIQEFRDAPAGPRKEEEMGDLLFTLVNIARKNDINPEDALRIANAKFRKRFNRLEEKSHSLGKEVSEMTLGEMDALWDEIKNEKP